MLRIEDLVVSYGEVPAVRGVSLDVGPGECVSLLGANGAGKSTLLKTISGLLRPSRGRVLFEGHDLTTLPPHEIVARGIAHVPEGRRVFPELTVAENLELGSFLPAAKRHRRTTMDEVFGLFPRLAERRSQLAGTLSGGEQQMLALGRGLMLRPRLLLLDEPSLGLAPVVVQELFGTIRRVLQAGTLSVLLVEQNAFQALRVANRGYVLEQGRIVVAGSSGDLRRNEQVRAAYLGG